MTDAATSPDLRSLGIWRIETPTPFPQVPTANAWLVAGDELTVIDTGSSWRKAWEVFQARVKEAGFAVSDIRRILVTHGHPDHAGLARAIAKRSGARVFIHEEDAFKVTHVSDERARALAERYALYYRHLGMPASFIEYMNQVTIGTLEMRDVVDKVEILHGGDRFDFGRFSLEVVACPGHTPGCTCFHIAEARVLFSGDHLLPKISPNPVLELGPEEEDSTWEGKFKSLVSYVSSLERTRALDLEAVLPGHGDPFTDHRRLIDELNRFHEIRQHRILQVMRAGEATVYELARQIFPGCQRIELFLSVSEIVGHLEVLEEEGKVERDFKEGRLYFRATEPAQAPYTKEVGSS
jgi:glyoxylase-like metal-dependent hydrolase (beta-lactamase superfamily II)